MSYFGTDGIRKKAEELTPALLKAIAKGLADYAESLGKDGTIKVLLGGDTRESTEWILSEFETDFESLGRANFKNLKKLDLGGCEISDLSFLENVDFPNIEELIAYENVITDISALEKVKFKKIGVLDLHFNQISDITALKNINFFS